MPTKTTTLKDQLHRVHEIHITVTGRKSGRAITNPVWFVFEGDTLYLLPVQGSATQWYKNVVNNLSIRIRAATTEEEFNAVPVTDAATVKWIADKFRAKYGAADVKKYYSKFDVAVSVHID
jgi:deazaflavin-dependent oxidoreductase (nitroreductase family)